MSAQTYKILHPQSATSAVVVASPHSGRGYTRAFLRSSVLDEWQIRSSEDAFVDLLVENAPQEGAALLLAEAPRAYVDLNRAAQELDPALIQGQVRGALNPRVSSGLGVIPRVVANGRAIYRGKITQQEAQRRLDEVWHPYHNALTGLLEDCHRRFGQAILVDVHSMPHEAIQATHQAGRLPPQIVLGDRFGASCDSAIMDQVQREFEREGLRVARNTPFAGAFIAQHYGRPSRGFHALQIEIDRALYMDEAQITPSPQFAPFQAKMHRIIAGLARISLERPQRLAAE